MIFRHGCGGDCGCECVPCNHCNENDDDLLPATITASFSFAGGSYGQCGALYDGESVVLVRGFVDGGPCPVCKYDSGSVCGNVEMEVRFLGGGLGVTVSLCGLTLSYLGEGFDCLQSATTFTNGAGVTVTLSPGGTLPPPKILKRPTSATVSLSFAEIGGGAAVDPLPNLLTPNNGNLSSWGPLAASDPYFATQVFVGLVAVFLVDQDFASISMQLRHACPFYWDIALTAYGQRVYSFNATNAIRRNIGFFGAVNFRAIPTLDDFKSQTALIPLAPQFHEIVVGQSVCNMLIPFNQWPGPHQSDWQASQQNGWLPAPGVAATPPAFNAIWTADF